MSEHELPNRRSRRKTLIPNASQQGGVGGGGRGGVTVQRVKLIGVRTKRRTTEDPSKK